MGQESGHVATPVAPEQPTAPTPQVPQQQEQSATPPHWSQQQRDDFGRWQQIPPPEAQPQTQQQPVEQDTGFTNVDPNTLPPEVQPIYKSLQADYTRKMQAIAEQRRQIEQYGDPDTLQQATELYSALQDPNNWPAIHQELTSNLQAMGYSPGEAQQEASRQMGEATTVAAQQQPSEDWAQDPELAPVKSYIEQLEHKLNNIESQWQQRQESEQQEKLQMALIGELQRQENVVRQANPHYTDQDVDAVYELSSYYGGNLLQAQQRYEGLFQDRLSRYMSSKGQAVEMGGVPLGGVVQPTETVQKATPSNDFEGAHQNVLERLRQLDAL